MGCCGEKMYIMKSVIGILWPVLSAHILRLESVRAGGYLSLCGCVEQVKSKQEYGGLS